MARLIEAASRVCSRHPLHSSARFTTHISRFTLIASGVTGLLFGLHPIHVESVAWVAERKDLLCGLFYLLSIMAYAWHAGRGGPLWPSKEGRPQGVALPWAYIFSLVFFILALMSKPMAVSLPLVLLILDWYPFKRITSIKTFSISLIEKIPFIALSVFCSIVTILAQRSGEAIRSAEFAPLSARLLVAGKSLITYLWSMVLPLNLSPFYPYSQKISLLSIEYILPLAIIAGFSIGCAVTAKRQKLWLSVWGYYFLTLMPVLGFIQVGNQAMADRYTYLPSLGPFLLVGLAVAWVLAKKDVLNRSYRASKVFTISAAIFVSLCTAYMTIRQISIWENSFTLWNFVIEKNPDNVPFAYYNRGLAFARIRQYQKSIEDFDRAISMRPFAHSEYYNNRGVSYINEKLFDKAIEDFQIALALDPNNNVAYYNRGLAYYRRGSSLLIAGDKELASADFQRACHVGNKKGCDALQALGS